MTLPVPTETLCCAVVELRQYTLKPGQRDVLIDLFDRYFLEGQESVGMTVIGQFRDRRRPDRFVWLRGFGDMEARHKALEAFYGGPIWAAHKAEANNTMVDSDDVLLLRPARPELAFRVGAENARGRSPATVLAGIYHLPQPAGAELVSSFEKHIAPTLKSNGVRIEGVFVTEPARNTFTRLPVREGEHVLAWFGTVERPDASRDWLEPLAGASALRHQPVILELEPTSRSSLGNGPDAARSSSAGRGFRSRHHQ